MSRLHNIDIEKFNSSDEFIPRSGNEVSTNNYQIKKSKNISQSITGNLKTGSTGEFNLQVISVDISEGDGMSWLTQDISNRIENSTIKYNQIILNSHAKDLYSLPAIVSIVGRKTFMKVAVKNKLAQSYLKIFSISQWFLLGLSISIAFIIKATELFLKNEIKNLGDNIASVFYSPIVIWSFLITLFITLTAKYVLENLLFTKEHTSIKDFIGILNLTNKKNGSSYSKLIDNFILDLSKKLQNGNFPRVIIIDNFSRLDYITKEVIRNYCERYLKKKFFGTAQDVIISIEAKENSDKLSSGLLFDIKRKGKNINFFKMFTVDFLSEKEKKELVSKLGLSEKNIDFDKVSDVVHGANILEIEEFTKVRDKSEIAKVGLNLLYLLSQSSIPSRNFISKEKIIQLLNNEDLEISNQVRLYIDFKTIENEITVDEFSNYFIKHFDNFLHSIQNVRDQKVFVLSKVVIHSILEHRFDLGFKSVSIGNFIWALIKGEKISFRRDKPYWIASLKFHIKNSDINYIKSQDENIKQRYYDLITVAISESHNLGLHFDLYELHDISKELLSQMVSSDNYDFNIQDDIHHLWMSYIMSKDDRLLSILYEHYSILNSNNSHQVDIDFESNPIIESYFEYIPLPNLEDNYTVENLAKNLTTSPYLKEYREFVIANSSLISMSILSSMHDINYTTIAQNSYKSLEEISKIRKQFAHNREFSRESFTIDLLSINTIIWCDNYYHSNSFIYNTLNPENLELSIKHNWPSTIKERIIFIKNSLEDYLLILRKIDQFYSDNYSNREFIHRALFGELFLYVLSTTYIAIDTIKSSIYTINFDAYDNDHLADAMQETINNTLALTNKFLGQEISPIDNLQHFASSKYLDHINELFNFYSLIWTKLGQSEFYNNLIIKRIQFGIFTIKRRDADKVSLELISSIDSVLKQTSYIGVLANITISKYLDRIAELSSVYFNNAGFLAIRNQFGQDIIQQLSYTAMLYYYRAGNDMSDFAEKILEEKKDKQENSYLNKILIDIPERSAFNVIFRLTNSMLHVKSKGYVKKINKILRKMPDRIKNNKIKRKTIALFDYVDFRDNLNVISEKEARRILNIWQDKKDLYFYAAILLQLFQRGFQFEYIKSEILNCLISPADRSFSTYQMLALAYAERYLLGDPSSYTQEEVNIVINFLRSEIRTWESLNEATVNSRIFGVLNHFFPGTYLEKYLAWHKIEVEVDHKKNLPKLLSDGNFFMIFKYYVDKMLAWKIPIDTSNDNYRRLISKTRDEMVPLTKNYLKGKSFIPNPIQNNKISHEFLVFGFYIINSIEQLSTKETALLVNYNEAAKENLPRLVELIDRMTHLPSYYRDIVNSFHDQYSWYARR